MWNLKNGVSEQTKQKQICTENRLMVARGEGCGEPGEEGKRTEKYRLVVTDESRRCKYSTGNTTTDIIITMYVARLLLEISEGTLSKV